MSRRRPEDEDQAHALGQAHADALAAAEARGEPLPRAPTLPTAPERIAFTRGLWSRRFADPYRTPAPPEPGTCTVPWTPRGRSAELRRSVTPRTSFVSPRARGAGFLRAPREA
jgi:hypothetical protein